MKQTRHWWTSFRLVSMLTALSRLTGYARDMAFAIWIGPGPMLDAFFVVTRLASMGRAFFAEGLVNAFIPILAQQSNLTEQKRLLLAVGIRVLAWVFLMCLMVFWQAEWLLAWITPGFVGDVRMHYASVFLKIVFWYLWQISCIALLGSLLNVHHYLGLTSALPCLLNIMLMLSAAMIGRHLASWQMLGWGVIFAGLLQIILVAWAVQRHFGHTPWKLGQHPDVRAFFRMMTGAFASTGMVQCATLIETLLATSLPSGAVSWVYYADRLIQLPLGVFGVSMVTVLLPKLAHAHAQQKEEDYAETLATGIEITLALGIPIMLIFLFMAKPTVTLLFEYGRFSAEDAIKSARCLWWMAWAMPALLISKLLAASSFAQKNVNVLTRSMMLATLANATLAWHLRPYYAQEAMAMGMCLGAWIHVTLLYTLASPISFKNLLKRIRWAAWSLTWMALGGLIFFMQSLWPGDPMHALGRWQQLIFWGGPAACFYLGALWLLFTSKARDQENPS